MGLEYSRPSASNNLIKGFDTSSIDLAKGRLFSENDIFILETLLWPFLSLYEYTNISKKCFLKNLYKIRPLIDNPLDFELEYYPLISEKSKNIKETCSFKLFHQHLINAWNTLDKSKTYPFLIKKL